MKVFCWARAGADIPHTQALCQWHRSWKDAGFEPFILTPASCAEPLDIEHVLKASQQPEHVWARWNAHYPRGHEDMLLVTPTILPAVAVRAEQMPPLPRKPSSPAFVSYDTHGRVIHTYKSPTNVMRELLRHDFSEFEGRGFTDLDLLLLDFPNSPTKDETDESSLPRYPMFVNYTPEQILELRAKRLAL